jgi:SPP1 gp7 family putative phage head morphogenesis protein
LHLVRNIAENQKKEVIKILSQGLVKGKTFSQMGKDINDYIPIYTEFQARRIAQTETIKAHHKAQIKIMQENGIEYVKWVTARDKDVCPKCKQAEGKIFAINEVPPIFHPFCRCVVVSYFKS